MGLENRDYYRDSSRDTYRPSGFSDMPVVCKRLLIATVAIFLLQIFITRKADTDDLGAYMQLYGADVEEVAGEMPPEAAEQMLRNMPRVSVLQDWMELDPDRIRTGQVWRLATYAFCHDRHGFWGLLINMLFLYWLGTRLEQMYGSREFCLFYFTSAIVAGILFLAFAFYTGRLDPAIGANGAIWGLVALYVIHHPYERINIYGVFPIEIRWLALLYLLFSLHPLLLAVNGESRFGGGVSYAVNIGGAAFGFLYFNRGWRLAPLLDRVTGQAKQGKWTTRTVERPRRNIIPMPRPDFEKPDAADPKQKRLDAELDAVLEKIQREGRDSLTESEVQTLEEASKQLRER